MLRYCKCGGVKSGVITVYLTTKIRSIGGEKTRISYDEVDDAMYIRFSETEYYESDEVKEGIILDFDKEGRIIALELLDVSRRFPEVSMDSINFEVCHPERMA